MENKYPLQWPSGRPRTPPDKVTWSNFNVTAGKAQKEMIEEIHRMLGKDIIISSNRRTKVDGTLYAADIQGRGGDNGIAVYFDRKGTRVCFCCDRYGEIWENMRAIGKTIEAMRGIERWGSTEMLDRAFTGFTALPAPMAMPHEKPWHEVLGVDPDASLDQIGQAYRSQVKGKTEDELKELNIARDEGRRARGD